jgi:hypothetical protein
MNFLNQLGFMFVANGAWVMIKMVMKKFERFPQKTPHFCVCVCVR